MLTGTFITLDSGFATSTFTYTGTLLGDLSNVLIIGLAIGALVLLIRAIIH